MAEQTILTKFKLRHDIASNWTSKNPVLLEGEIGFETDTLNFKVGNGSSNWNSLKYYIPDTSKFVTEDKLPDTSKFITISADNLINYYLKSETYTKEEVNSIVNNVSKFNAVIVTTLPTSNISSTTIYLIAKTDTENNDYYDEYLYINNAWEMIGNTKIDLSNYYTRTQADSVFAKKTDIPVDIMDLSSNQTVTGEKGFNIISVNKIQQADGTDSFWEYENKQVFGSSKDTVVMGKTVTLDTEEKPKWYNPVKDETKDLATTDDIPIKIITDTSVRIWNLASGTYILPNNCKIYYNGATNTANYYNAQGDRTILEVNASSAGTEKFFRFSYTTGFNAYYQYYIFTGMTTASNGYVKGLDFNNPFTIDSELSTTSTNAVQNSVVTTAIANAITTTQKESGGIKLSNGLIINWGNVTPQLSGTTVNLSIPFTTTNYTVAGSNKDVSSKQIRSLAINTYNTASFICYGQWSQSSSGFTGGDCNFRWLAIGY